VEYLERKYHEWLLKDKKAMLHPLVDKIVSLRDSMAFYQELLACKEPETSSTPLSPRKLAKDLLTDTKVPEVSIERHQADDIASHLLQRTGDLAVYGFYLSAVGPISALLMTVCTATYSFALTFSSNILKWAVQAPSEDLRMYMVLYVAVSGIAWIATNGTMW
jgi:hypothetical protein